MSDVDAILTSGYFLLRDAQQKGFVRGLLLGTFLTGVAWWISGCATAPPAPRECAPMPDIDAVFAELVLDAGAELGPLSVECAAQVQGVKLVHSAEEMPEVCWLGNGTVLGCQAFDQNGYSHIWIVECQRNPRDTLRMERLHALLGCIGDPDPNHAHPIWRRLGL